MEVVCDIETTAIDNNEGIKSVKKIWIIVCHDIATGKEYIFDTDEKIKKDFVEFSKQVTKWIGHNFLSFDLPVINNLTDASIDWRNVVDTMVLSQLFNYHVIKYKVDKKTKKPKAYKALKRSKHSLEAWGIELGYAKQEHEDWSQYTEEMKSRCVTDVRLNVKVYRQLLEEGEGYSTDSIINEHVATYIAYHRKEVGFAINMREAQKLYDELKTKADKLTHEIVSSSEIIYTKYKLKTLRFKKDGTPYPSDVEYIKKHKYKRINKEQFQLYKPNPFNPRSPTVVLLHLNKAGWKPTEMTKVGNPSTTSEVNLATLPDSAPPAYRKYAELVMLNARLNEIKGWFDNMCEKDRVHGTVFTCGAVTHRMSHIAPNTANIPGSQSPYGHECRALWTVGNPDKQVLLGTDASGVQLRMLAHHINDPEYTRGVCEDAHTTHQHILGLPDRATAKTWMYAWLFGAKAGRLGRIMGGSHKDGQDAMNLFEERVTGLTEFKRRMEAESKRGYVIGLDGRRISVPNLHGTLPAHLQGGESVVMKVAERLWWFTAKQRGWDFNEVGYIHDEWQTEMSKQLVTKRKKVEDPDEGLIWSKPVNGIQYYSELGELQVKAIRRAGELLNLNCPLDGEYVVGKNWAQTH